MALPSPGFLKADWQMRNVHLLMRQWSFNYHSLFSIIELYIRDEERKAACCINTNNYTGTGCLTNGDHRFELYGWIISVQHCCSQERKQGKPYAGTLLNRKARPVAPVKRVEMSSARLVRMVSQLAQEKRRVPPMWSKKIRPIVHTNHQVRTKA